MGVPSWLLWQGWHAELSSHQARQGYSKHQRRAALVIGLRADSLILCGKHRKGASDRRDEGWLHEGPRKRSASRATTYCEGPLLLEGSRNKNQRCWWCLRSLRLRELGDAKDRYCILLSRDVDAA